MVYDRTLSPSLLDAGLRIATSWSAAPDAHPLLGVALRDHVTDQEASGKTKDVLSRVWLSPRSDACPMVRWAIEHQDLAPRPVVLHLGALLAAFPFFGIVAGIAGRQLHLHGEIDLKAVRTETAGVLGDRSTIDRGASSVLTTLRRLGLIEGDRRRPTAASQRPEVPLSLTGWLTHALLLTRQVTAIGTDEPPRAFELATLAFTTMDVAAYPLLEVHAEAVRTVAVPVAPSR